MRTGAESAKSTARVAERAQAAHEVLPPNLRPVRDQDAVRVIHASAEVEDDIGNEVHVHEELDPPVAVSDLSLHVKPHAQRHHDGHVQQEKGLAEVPDLAEPSFRVDEPDLFAVLLRGAADPDHGEIVALRQQRRLRRLSAHCTQRTASAAAYGERWQRAGTANGAGGSVFGGARFRCPASSLSAVLAAVSKATIDGSGVPGTVYCPSSGICAARAARSSFSAAAKEQLRQLHILRCSALPAVSAGAHEVGRGRAACRSSGGAACLGAGARRAP